MSLTSANQYFITNQGLELMILESEKIGNHFIAYESRNEIEKGIVSFTDMSRSRFFLFFEVIKILI